MCIFAKFQKKLSTAPMYISAESLSVCLSVCLVLGSMPNLSYFHCICDISVVVIIYRLVCVICRISLHNLDKCIV
jgi:hypothetical protein